MLKKCTHIISVLLVLISTIGIIIPEHHCIGYVNGEIIEKPDGSCCDPNEEMPPDCCENELHCFWLDADFQSRPSAEIIVPIYQVIHIPTLENEILQKDVQFTYNHSNYSPPPLIRNIFIVDQAFLL